MKFKNNNRILFTFFLIVLSLLLTSCSNEENMVHSSWLKENHGKLNVKDINDFSGLEILDDEIEGNKIILLGEIHGVAANQKLEEKLIRYIKEKTNFKYLLVEDSYSGAYFINKYLETGDIKILEKLFKSLKGTYAYTEDNYRLFKELYEYNQSLPKKDRIMLVGVDIEHQPTISFDYIKDILPKEEAPEEIETIINDLRHKSWVNYNDILESLNNNREIYIEYLDENYLGFNLVIENLKNRAAAYDVDEKDWDQVRDEMMYNNFITIDNYLDDGIYFGQWGMNRIFQEKFDGVDWFASRVNNTKKYKGKILPVNFWYDDYKQREPDGIEYNLSFGDDIIQHHKSIGGDINIYKLIGEDSPYNNEEFNLEERSNVVDLFQYIIVISGSESSTILKM